MYAWDFLMFEKYLFLYNYNRDNLVVQELAPSPHLTADWGLSVQSLWYKYS